MTDFKSAEIVDDKPDKVENVADSEAKTAEVSPKKEVSEVTGESESKGED